MEKWRDVIPINAETRLIFFVNGKKVIENNPDPEWTLLWYLRKKLQLTGTKYGCGEGGCGACTVMLSQYMKYQDKVKHYAVNACLTPACAVHGLAVTTVEGIGTTETRLHPVQERIAKAHGSQCGFCTPGIVMSMYALIRNKIKFDYNDIESALQGNLCRCTGYRPIIEGLKTFTEGWKTGYVNNLDNRTCALKENCCKNNKDKVNENELYNKSTFRPYDPSQEPIFPPELMMNSEFYNTYLYYNGSNATWIRPTKLEELYSIKMKIPTSKIVVGNTEVGVEMNIKKMSYPILIYINLIEELKVLKIANNCITVGGSVSLTDLESALKEEMAQNKNRKLDVIREIVIMLHWFAGNQVRNVASLAGNIVTASPISDMNPILMACKATVNVFTPGIGCRTIPIDEHFFKGYRKTIIDNNEVVLSIDIPFNENQYFKAYKQARRKDDDIAIVTAAFNIIFKDNTKIINEAKLCYGGMAPITISAKDTELYMKELEWNDTTIETVLHKLSTDMHLEESSPGGMAVYRKSLCLSLFYKFNNYIRDMFKNNLIEEHVSSIFPKSSQIYEIRGKDRKRSDTVGLPVLHASAYKQVTGEAIYCDDIPPVEGELFMTLVFSSKPYAKIISINADKALKLHGVVAFYCANDLDNDKNVVGPLNHDEEIFSRNIVTSRACVVGAIIAESEQVARKAKRLVEVEYVDLEPVIITLEDAIANNSYFPHCPIVMKKGDVNKSFDEADYSLDGFCRSGAQEHFYLETIGVIATRKEDELEIIVSSQAPTEIAQHVSRILDIPQHKVVTKVKRLGGGFGGKETRAAILAVPAAIAAYKLKKSVRAVFDRDEDMQCTGYRHPHLIKYKVAFDKNGIITGAKFDMYNNAGNSRHLSYAVNERASFHLDNCYNIPNFEVNGYVCKTNLPSNTAFRGFGAPQAMLATEHMMRDIAKALHTTYENIAAINMYKEGDLTHFNQVLTHCTIDRCWAECMESSNYWQRKRDAAEFNRKNRWKKKGISLVPTKYGISFQRDILMQGAALVLIYTDGSVLITIGGIEMGQGLYTKMIQVASRVLDIDISKIHISENSTDKIPNSSPTAASISSDLYGMAVINACNKLVERLKPYKEKDPMGKWEDWVNEAFVDRTQLAATGFYAAPKIVFDFTKNSGQMFEYFTFGAACSEVLIDCLTGDHEVLRTDIVMDVGESLNPAIDIGQIEGAFTQGRGLFTIEELVFSPQGELYSRGPGTYKIPGFSDIPHEFNVSLLKGAPNPRAVYSSKAVGEPPLFLAASIFFAIKEAIAAARIDSQADPNFRLDAPATCERIRMACEDFITRTVEPTVKNKGNPWNVMI